MNRLFAERERTSQAASSYTESMYAFLDRSGWVEAERIRSTLEDWFSRYPSEEQAELLARLLDRFDAPFFELYLHELLLRQGGQVTVHPEVGSHASSKRPDFLVVDRSGRRVVVEAVIATDVSDEEGAATRLQDAVLDSLNEIHIPDFSLDVHVFKTGTKSPTRRRIVAFLVSELRKLDADEVVQRYGLGGFEAVPNLEFIDSVSGTEIHFRPIPLRPEVRGNHDVPTVGMLSRGEARWIRPGEPIRSRIRKKAGRYGEIGGPYVIAVNALASFLPGRRDIVDALYGNAEVLSLWQNGAIEREAAAAQEGAWRTLSGPQNTRVSAALVFKGLVPFSMTSAPAWLCHNPWAKHPLPEGWLAVPELRWSDEQVTESEPQILAAQFGLPLRWPNEGGLVAPESSA